MADIDIYGIARLLVQDSGEQALNEVQEKIDFSLRTGDSQALKRWYEIEEAIKAILVHEEEEVVLS